jgi:hypothetical protein
MSTIACIVFGFVNQLNIDISNNQLSYIKKGKTSVGEQLYYSIKLNSLCINDIQNEINVCESERNEELEKFISFGSQYNKCPKWMIGMVNIESRDTTVTESSTTFDDVEFDY